MTYNNNLFYNDNDINDTLKAIDEHIKKELKSRLKQKKDWRTYECGEDKGCNKVARPFNT
jgi:hypothetical protein